MTSLFLSTSSHSRPFPKLRVTFSELRPPPPPPAEHPSPPSPPKPPDPPDCLVGASSSVLLPLFTILFPQISDLSPSRSVACSGSLVPSFVFPGDTCFAVKHSITAVCRFLPGFGPASTSTRIASGFLISFPSISLNCRFDNGMRWSFVPILVSAACMNALVVDKAFVHLLSWVLVTKLCLGYSYMEFDVLAPLPFGENICVVGNKNFPRVVRRYTLSSFRAEEVVLKVSNSIVDGRLILSDHFSGDSALPCIEVFVRQVLTLYVAKGFVPIISISIYGFVDVKWEVQSLYRDAPPHLGKAGHRFIGSALFAETLAMKLALADALSSGFHKLNVSSDCKALISLLNSGTSTVELRSLLHDIRELIVSFTSISFTFIPRLGNVYADKLAKSALIDVIDSSVYGG